MESELQEFNCLVKDCKQKFDDLFFYSRHLVSYHGLPINIMYLKFKNKTEFTNWKAQEQITNNCMFNTTNRKQFFRCHRSSYILNSVREDNLINNQDEERFYKVKAPCPAHLKYEFKDDQIHVMYVRTHYGYCNELKDIAISDETTKLVRELGPKMQDIKIVDKIRTEMKDQHNTDYLITTRHVMNIIAESEKVINSI